jgi:DNA-binding transcriptional ArsR family regulator
VLPAVQVLRDPAQAAATLKPWRLQILEKLAEPNSAVGVAKELSLPRQQVNYHIRELERHRLVEPVGQRQKGNCTERLVRATAKSYLVSPEVLGSLGATPEERRDRFSCAYLLSAAARLIRDLAVLAVRARKAEKRLSTLALETEVRFRSAEERNRFAEELANTLAVLAARYHDETASDGRRFRFLVGAYPVITKQEDDGAESALMD